MLDGEGGIMVLLNIMTKAKFGEAFDPDTLFNRPLAELINDIMGNGPFPQPSDGPFSRLHLMQIAESIVDDSFQSGWWGMSQDERNDFVQNVVVSPHKLSSEQMSELMDCVEDAMFNRRRIIEAADKASTA